MNRVGAKKKPWNFKANKKKKKNKTGINTPETMVHNLIVKCWRSITHAEENEPSTNWDPADQ